MNYNISFSRTDTVKRARHGLPWTEQEYETLARLFSNQITLRTLCEVLQRPADGVLSKLRALRLVTYDMAGGYRYTDKGLASIRKPQPETQPETQPQPETPKDEIMTKQLIENKTIILGVDAASMDDDTIFTLIAKTEGEIAKLQAIKTSSKKLAATIAKKQADVQKLADYVDGRDSQP